MSVTDLERHLVFKVAQGDEKNLPLIHSLRSTSKDYFKILSYCARSGITGPAFTQLFADHQGSTIRVISTILRKMENSRTREFGARDLR